jgi:DNA-binding MarR family transcriptional regulator
MHSIHEALALLDKLRALDADMPMAQAYSLLLIARDEGLSLKELATRAGVGMASASRYLADFTLRMGLATAKEDPNERRKKIITLTPKGRALVNKLLGDK